MHKKLPLITILFLLIAGSACKTEPVSDTVRGGCGLLDPVWGAASVLDDRRITLSVTSGREDRQIEIVIRQEGRSSPLETIVLAPGIGKLSTEWHYDCDKYRGELLRARPRVFFTASYGSESCAVKSPVIPVGATIRVANRDGFGEPVKNLTYELISFSPKGEEIHRLKGVTGNDGLIYREDLIPCIRYNVKVIP